jgi:phosphatidylglycerophosphate synthase
VVPARRDARGAVAAGPRIASTSALLYATAPAAEGGPAAALGVPEGTLLGRLLGQLDGLGVRRAWVVARPDGVAAVERAAAEALIPVEVLPSHDLGEDLRIAAEVAGRVRGQLLLARGEALAHREALAGLLADPRIVSGILATPSARRARWAFRTRSSRGRLVSASSPFHRTGDPTGFFLGFLKVDARDREVLAGAAKRLAALTADGLPDAWEAELERKGLDWRRELWLAAERERTGMRPERAERPVPAEMELAATDEATLALRMAAARADAVSVLLVGMIRGGAQLGASQLRGFYSARPLSRAAVEEAWGEMAQIDEDKVALSSAVKATDGFFTTFFVSPYSRYIARYCARQGWTPNQMTTVSMVIGTVAALAFATGSRTGLIAGAVLLQAAFTVDCVDGQLARYTRTFSKLGAWLDSVFDRGKEYVVYAGLAVGSLNGFDRNVWTLAAAALTLQTVRHAFAFSFAATRHVEIAATPQRPLEEPADHRLWTAERARAARLAREAAAGGPEAAVRGGGGTAVATPVEHRVTAAEPVPALSPEDPATEPETRRVGLAGRAVRLIRAVDRFGWVVWLKRIIVLPIGERFALVSITAALWSPHVTFVALLAWGGFAALYSVGGQVLRTLAR